MLCLAALHHEEALQRYVAKFPPNSTICGLAFLETCPDVKAYLTMMMDWHEHRNLPDGIVGSSLYLEIVDGEVLGVIMLRHELNDFLERIGGHIGYSVAPTHRRKGIAKKMLTEIVKIAQQQYHMTTCLVSCAESNIASRQTIKACKGKLLRKAIQEGITYEMYEIGG